MRCQSPERARDMIRYLSEMKNYYIAPGRRSTYIHDKDQTHDFGVYSWTTAFNLWMICSRHFVVNCIHHRFCLQFRYLHHIHFENYAQTSKHGEVHDKNALAVKRRKRIIKFNEINSMHSRNKRNIDRHTDIKNQANSSISVQYVDRFFVEFSQGYFNSNARWTQWNHILNGNKIHLLGFFCPCEIHLKASLRVCNNKFVFIYNIVIIK